MMPLLVRLCCLLLLLIACAGNRSAVQIAPGVKTLKPASVISLNVHGRIDHFALDRSRKHLFVAALGNNSVEVIDLNSRKVIHSIGGLDEPQGVGYFRDRLYIANGNGKVEIYNAETFVLLETLDLKNDADNVKVDSARGRILIGAGSGELVTIDAASGSASAIPLSAHPEAFEEEPDGSRVYVNVPSSEAVEVIDMQTRNAIAHWQRGSSLANFPMALDAKDHLLFVGCRNPASLVVLDTRTGKQVQQIGIGNDVDDLFLDKHHHRLYASCGVGEIDIVSVADRGHFAIIDTIVTPRGSRTSFFDTISEKLYLAVPERDDRGAEVRVYDVVP